MDHIARQDRAIENTNSDVLERGPFVSSLVKTLVHTEYTNSGDVVSRRATGFVVGLTGEWGLGKSSVLNLLGLELKQMKHVVVATLNPWLFKGRDELLEAYFNSLREALGQSTSEKTKNLLHQLERYKASIEYVGTTTANLIDILIGGNTAKSFFKRVILKFFNSLSKPEKLSTNQERKSLERKLAEEKIAVVVLIDELDRIEDEEVRAVAQLVKAVGDIKGISYMVAYDPDRVAQALGRGNSLEERQKNGESYLEKIIQLPIPLRPLFEDDSRKLLIKALHNNGLTIKTAAQPYESAILNELLRVIRTPREIKRLIGAFSVLDGIVHGEICPYDVLAYCWLISKTPNIRRCISDRIQTLVSDPGTDEILRQQRRRHSHNNTNETLLDVLGEPAKNHLKLLHLLFPRFSEGGYDPLETPIGNRITKRRNLTRLIYLGNPPSQLSRTLIEKLWLTHDINELTNELSTLQRSSQLKDLIDRIGDFVTIMPQSGDQFFWVALSKKLVRDHDWVSNEEEERGLVDDVSSILWRLGHTSEGGSKRFRKIMQALIESGDLLFTPWILRKHLFAFGLTPYISRESADHIYDRDETIMLLERELPRYRSAALEGVALRRLPDTEAIFCLLNSNNWDETLKTSLTSQLNSKDSIGSLAALILPPGIFCDRHALDILFDADIILDKITHMFDEKETYKNEWLTTCIRRLRDTLKTDNTRTPKNQNGYKSEHNNL